MQPQRSGGATGGRARSVVLSSLLSGAAKKPSVEAACAGGLGVVVRVRVAALAIRGNRVLLARHVKNNRTSFLLPGGGMEPNETARVALARELREEAGVTCKSGELRYVVEARSPNGSKHLLQLVFAVDIEGEVGTSTDARVAACEWHDIESLRTLNLHPAVGAVLADDLRGNGSTQCRYLVAPWVV